MILKKIKCELILYLGNSSNLGKHVTFQIYIVLMNWNNFSTQIIFSEDENAAKLQNNYSLIPMNEPNNRQNKKGQ